MVEVSNSLFQADGDVDVAVSTCAEKRKKSCDALHELEPTASVKRIAKVSRNKYLLMMLTNVIITCRYGWLGDKIVVLRDM